jgi:23S rRNA (adenine2503-C2)-methyltransferase
LKLHSLELFQRCDSEVDGASKLLFRTETGMLIESVVLRIASGRTTLCVSSQVGCAAACDFCATGKMGIAQNLSSEQILDQVLQAGQLLAREDRKLRNIVFMGMGEPFHNEANLHETIELLTAKDCFHHPPTKILVSSVGVADAMLRCAEAFPNVNLALSLHSVRQEVRETLIPLAKKHPLDQLRDALLNINRLQNCTVMIEYLMLAGMNDSADDARELIGWLEGLNVHVNLIPYNPIEDAPHLEGTEPEARERFAEQLKEAGLKTTIRYSLGNDIAAACGQLVKKENRELARSLRILTKD